VRVQVGLLLCTGWLSPLFEFMKQWFPRFAEIEAPISVNVIWMHSISMASLMRRSM